MQKRALLAVLCSLALLISAALRPSQAADDSSNRRQPDAIESPIDTGSILTLAAADEPRRRPRGSRGVKEDDDVPAPKAQPPKVEAPATPQPASAQPADAQPAAPAEPQPPAAPATPVIVSTPQESLAIFSIQLIGRIANRLAGTPAAAPPARTVATQPVAPVAAKAANDNAGPKGGLGSRKDDKEGAAAQNTEKTPAAAPAAANPNVPVIKIDPNRLKGFRKGDKGRK